MADLVDPSGAPAREEQPAAKPAPVVITITLDGPQRRLESSRPLELERLIAILSTVGDDLRYNVFKQRMAEEVAAAQRDAQVLAMMRRNGHG